GDSAILGTKIAGKTGSCIKSALSAPAWRRRSSLRGPCCRGRSISRIADTETTSASGRVCRPCRAILQEGDRAPCRFRPNRRAPTASPGGRSRAAVTMIVARDEKEPRKLRRARRAAHRALHALEIRNASPWWNELVGK